MTSLPVDADPAPAHEPYAVLSCGGGARHRGFLLAAMEAFRHLSAAGEIRMRLVVFAGAFADARDLAAIETAARGGPFVVRPFGPEFERLLAGCELSISRAGYNTCAALLGARVRAVLAPDPIMSDQGIRAARLAELGLAEVVESDDDAIDPMVLAIRRAMAALAPQHGFALDGVARTRALIDTLDAWAH